MSTKPNPQCCDVRGLYLRVHYPYAVPPFPRPRPHPLPHPMVVECPWLSAAPMAAPMCISGPSGPTGSPLATTSPQDTNLTASVATLNSCGTEKRYT